MRELELTLRELLVAAASSARFDSAASDAKRKKETLAKADRLATLAAEIETFQPGALGGDRDPSLSMIARLLADQTENARQNLRAGHSAYARELIQSLPQYCLACHSRTGSGPSFRNAGDAAGLSELAPLEQAQYYAAVRQFDRALSIYGQYLKSSDKDAPYSPRWELAARNSLAIAIRVENDAAKAEKIVDTVLSNPQAPAFLGAQAEKWKASIARWKKETDRRKKAAQRDGEAELLAVARRLMEEGRKEQLYPADRSGDVSFLRATATLHELLSRYPQGKNAAEALYLAGLNYQTLRDLGLWELHSFYFLGCLHQAPHSELARRCYREYEQNVFLSFSGSSGTHLPEEVKAELATLRTLAAPLATPKESARPGPK
jgi:hypothetical protein